MHEKNANGIVCTIDFQLIRSVGRLSNINTYSETINIIKEMLKEEGLDGKDSNIFDNYDYIPNLFSINSLEIQKIFFCIMIFLKKLLNKDLLHLILGS